ncbi:MAG TPA: energy transducer TonB [Pyrinomonadaceae bacterium]|nr:energy transducer TonB [Pyrinomonadaceae bacterium]
MLDQLVESKSHTGENTKRGGFLLTTFVIVTTLFAGGIVYSLFAKDLGTSDEGLELSTLVAPPLPEEAPPPPPEPEQKPEKQVTSEKATTEIVRTDQFASVENTTTPPKDTRGQQNVAKWVPGAKLGDRNVNPSTPNAGVERGENTGGGITQSAPSTPVADDDPPPPPKPTPKPTAEPTPKPAVPKIISKGVVNGSAISLPKPPYPPAAKAVRAAGTVSVQVTIDENGNVISASAAGGHPLLQQAAVGAARQAKFRPTLLSGTPVKVTGIITYNFVAQ